MPKFLQKFLFSVAVLNTALMAQASDSIMRYDQFTKSLNQTMGNDLSIRTIFILLFAIVTVVIVVVLFEIYRSNKLRNATLALAWDKFEYHIEHLKLTRSNIDLLREIAYEAGLQEPDSMVKSSYVFENALEKYYASKRIDSIATEKLNCIRNLRKTLGFLPLSREMAFTSTRQFDNGEKCLVQIPAVGNATHKGMCSVLGIEEQCWSIARPDGPQIPSGTSVRMNLTRPGDAEYSFVTQTIMDSNGELVLVHTSKLNRAQQRNWVRVDVSIPVEVAQVENNRVGDILFGKIIDMSGGGFGMALPVRLKNGSMLKLTFELPGQGNISDLLVKVVRVAGQYNNDPTKTVHSVAFEGEVHSIQEQIIQYVFEKQRQESLINRS